MDEQANQNPPPGDTSLQFDRVELADAPSPEAAPVAVEQACLVCKQTIVGPYYQVGDKPVCEACQVSLRAQLGASPSLGQLAKGSLFGAGVAVVGALVWFGIIKATGYELGLVAVFVGYGVGWAVNLGAGGLRGWRPQALAMFLTYVSVGGAYALMAFGESDKLDGAGLVGTAIAFSLLTLAMPVLMARESIMGAIIIGIGIYEAWKTNRRIQVEFTGPFAAPAVIPAQAAHEP